MSEYTSVSIPKKVAERINVYIQNHPEEGYSSVADFIKDAIRKQFERKFLKKNSKFKIQTQEG